MPGIATEFLFTLALEVPVLALGDTPYGERRIARFAGGTFDGPRLRGKLLPGRAGWMLLRRDNVLDIEVRIILETDDQQTIYMYWKGLRHGSKDVIDHLNRGEAVDPLQLLFPHYAILGDQLTNYSWLNRICSIATASRDADRRAPMPIKSVVAP